MTIQSLVTIGAVLVSLGSTANAAPMSHATSGHSSSHSSAPATKAILADESMLLQAGVNVLRTENVTGVAYAEITLEQEKEISRLSHEAGKCGGFEMLPPATFKGVSAQSPVVTGVFGQLAERELLNRRFVESSKHFSTMMFNPTVQSAVDEVNADNMKKTVQMMSGFQDRLYNGSRPNDGVNALKTLIEQTVKDAPLAVQVELVPHRSIKQNSIRARIVGSTRPNEIVVLGGHLDSINQDWFGPKQAPGADDNASGSSNILEALRILSHQAQPERTIEFFWYAGEEGGLIGSAEIAQDYKAQGKDVVGVLQLDMTLFPGDGKFVLGSMTDFTSAWLRSYLVNLNGIYIKAKIVDDKCGYGCSDHASWNRQGYPSIMPFEATFKGMNHNLHTTKDVIDNNSNFEHSAMFSKIAVAIAMDLGNSEVREPK